MNQLQTDRVSEMVKQAIQYLDDAIEEGGLTEALLHRSLLLGANLYLHKNEVELDYDRMSTWLILAIMYFIDNQQALALRYVERVLTFDAAHPLAMHLQLMMTRSVPPKPLPSRYIASKATKKLLK